MAFEYLRSITHARLELREAMRCYISVLKWCRWTGISLHRDLAVAARQVAALTFGADPVREINASRSNSSRRSFECCD
jgi:hypothetical protein